MLTIRQKTLAQAGMAAVLAFLLALIFSSGFVAAVGWSIVVFLAFGFLIRQNVRVSTGIDVLREDVPHVFESDKEGTSAPEAASTPASTDEPIAARQEEAPGGSDTDEPQDGKRPASLDAPRGDDPDDLTRISGVGVGPKLQDMPISKSYYHLDQIAAWSDQELDWIDDALDGFKGRASRDECVKQAQRLKNEDA